MCFQLQYITASFRKCSDTYLWWTTSRDFLRLYLLTYESKCFLCVAFKKKSFYDGITFINYSVVMTQTSLWVISTRANLMPMVLIIDIYSVFVSVKNGVCWASLVAQRLRICLPMQGTRVRALVWEDPTCRGATRPASHSYWACASGACAPQQERPRQSEARAPRWRVAPALLN